MEPLLKARATGQVHRGNDLAAIHIEATACGLIKPARDGFPRDDDDYRQLVRTLSNNRTDSAGALDHTERARLLAHLRTLKKSLGLHTGPLPQWGKLRALWGELHKQNLVRTNTEPAMNAWAKAQPNGGQKDSARWCNNDELSKLIEAAKAWLKRGPRAPKSPLPQGEG